MVFRGLQYVYYYNIYNIIIIIIGLNLGLKKPSIPHEIYDFMPLILLLFHFSQITWMAVLYQINYFEDYNWCWKPVIISGYLSLFISIDATQI